MALSVAKVPFWEGASNGALLYVIPKSCVLMKTVFFIVFQQATQSFADMRECNFKTKWGVVLPECRKVFFCFFLVLVVLFFFHHNSVFCFVQNRPKLLFSCMFRGFLSVFLPTHKRPVLHCFFSSYFVFLFLSSLSKFHYFLCFLSINPF